MFITQILNSCYIAGFKYSAPQFTVVMPEHHDTSEYLEAIRKGSHATADIADEVGVARQSADERLRKLADEGLVEKGKVGNSLYWSLPNGSE